MSDKDKNIAGELTEIAEYIKNVKFRKKTLGGVDEADVWKKLQYLDDKYEEAYRRQDERNRAILKEKDERIKILEFRLYSLINNRSNTK